MIELISLIQYIQIIITTITILLAVLYSIPIVLIHRFRNFNNIFTINICLTIIFCNIYWIIYYILFKFYPQYLIMGNICSILIYFEMMCTFQVSLAFLVMSINRLCCIVYHTKNFFKKKQWIILCITIQWISGIIFSLPRILFDEMSCTTPSWARIYIFVMIVINPALICFIIHVIIFNHNHSSTHRVHPSNHTTGNDTNNQQQQQQQRINRRDIHFIRRVIIMFCIFIGGWSPIYIFLIIIPDFLFTLFLSSCFFLLAQFCLSLDIISLYVYNHEVRKYLKNIILKCFLME